MVQDGSNSDFDAAIQLTTTSPFIAVPYICKPRFTSDTLKLHSIFKLRSYNLYEKRVYLFLLSFCNHKLLSLDQKQLLFKLSNACYFKAYVSHKKSPKLPAQICCKFPLVISLLICCFSHLGMPTPPNKWRK